MEIGGEELFPLASLLTLIVQFLLTTLISRMPINRELKYLFNMVKRDRNSEQESRKEAFEFEVEDG